MTTAHSTDQHELRSAADDASASAVASPTDAMQEACARVAPLWPLDRFVAVNPYLGLMDLPFGDAAARLERVGGVPMTLPTDDYLDAIERGTISVDDVASALTAHEPGGAPDVDVFLDRARAERDSVAALPRIPTVAEVATHVTGADWTAFAVDRVSAWAASYFDEGQSTWRPATARTPLLEAWLAEAAIDRTPEIMGLRGFRSIVRALPPDPTALVGQALHRLSVPPGLAEAYLHALLLRHGGWAAHAARIAWEHAQRGEVDTSVLEFLAVCSAWDLAIRETLDVEVADAWNAAVGPSRLDDDADSGLRAIFDRVVLQEAFDRAAQRRVIEQFRVGATAEPVAAAPSRPRAQAVFCIDVRSEVLRRHLEAVDDAVETIGFAGFFGFPVEYVRLGHETGDPQCPVLLTPVAQVHESLGDAGSDDEAAASRRLTHHVRRAWKSFKMGAVSCFSFVGPVGLAYLPKLITDASGLTRPVPHPEDEALPAGARHHTGPATDELGLATKVQLASGALRGMSLTENFAPIVLLVGHGSNTVNNPYAAGLDCGACGGHGGEANARVAAEVCNDPAVRAQLATLGIVVPDDTWFVAAAHDTTTDRITCFPPDLPAEHAELLAALTTQFAAAAAGARRERAPRLGITDGPGLDAAVTRRSTDWAQVRPEWGLAGCHSFVVARRSRTRSLDLGGRAFLHSYDWRSDADLSVLELIMTAPMVVASWINLQYYASTVAPEVYGSGNKTLHNVVGQLGVFEGNGGDLRVGLPRQSVHDGERSQHEPLRLMVVIDAPTEAIDTVLAAHPEIRTMVDHGWVHLFAMDDTGAIAHRYTGDLRWSPTAVSPSPASTPPEEVLP